MILRDAAGLVVDSLNYGLLVDPWASEGYQAASGAGQGGCRVVSPGGPGGFGGFGGGAPATNRSAGRFPDGADTDSNCADFLVQPATTMPFSSAAGATNIKVAGVAEFAPGQEIIIDTGANQETATIASVGTPGGTTVAAATNAGATVIPVTAAFGFAAGQTIAIDGESAVVASTAGGGRGGRGGGATITVSTPLTSAHAAGAQVSGTGITLATGLAKPHAGGAPVAGNLPTPGAPNRYSRRPN
jgi:hypothetical protein